MTTSTSLTANTAKSVLVGNYIIQQIQYATTTAGNLVCRDASDTTETQSDPEYDIRVVTSPYTRSATARDLRDSTITYNYSGQSTEDDTVAADATADLVTDGQINNAAAGTSTLDCNFLVGRGLQMESTVNATVVITYEPNP